jgi:PadR family transcriptional regulator, regulatory protein AphA
MNVQPVFFGGMTYVECLPDGEPIASEADALDLVAACGEHDTQRLLLHAENLPDEFFHLSNGLAGKILLKFSNYYLRVAAVLPSDRTRRGKFYEMMLETNRGNEFRIFEDRAAAQAWLIWEP